MEFNGRDDDNILAKTVRGKDRERELETIRKPFRNAKVAVLSLRDLVSNCIREGYRKPSLLEEPEHSCNWRVNAARCGGSVIGASFCGIGIMGMGGGLLAALACFGLGAGLIVASYKYARYQISAAGQFAYTRGRLLRAVARLPDGTTKNLVRQFAAAAEQAFILGRISAIQHKVTTGHGNARQLTKMYRDGVRLIEKAAESLNWDKEKRHSLREAFKAGQLVAPEAYLETMDIECQRAQGTLELSMTSSPPGRQHAPKVQAIPSDVF